MREELYELLYKNRSWNLKKALSEGCTICEPPSILRSEKEKRSCENEASCEKIDRLR